MLFLLHTFFPFSLLPYLYSIFQNKFSKTFQNNFWKMNKFSQNHSGSIQIQEQILYHTWVTFSPHKNHHFFFVHQEYVFPHLHKYSWRHQCVTVSTEHMHNVNSKQIMWLHLRENLSYTTRQVFSSQSWCFKINYGNVNCYNKPIWKA